jgi:ketosteroid isomerase-like protein
MVRISFALLLSASALAFAPLAAMAQNTTAPIIAAMSPGAQEAAKVVDSFHAALARGDAAAATALLTEDALVYEGGYAERSRAEYASHHAGADAAYAAAAPSNLLRRSGRVDAGTAWITSESRATGTYKDKAVDRPMTETMVLRNTTDGWRIAHIHWSSRPAT